MCKAVVDTHNLPTRTWDSATEHAIRSLSTDLVRKLRNIDFDLAIEALRPQVGEVQPATQQAM